MSNTRRREEMSKAASNGSRHTDVNIAIIGGSYGGLSLANALHLHSINYTIFDRRSLPYNHVMGGSFNIPSFPMLEDRLQLKRSISQLTRKDVIDLLIERVKTNLIPGSNVVDVLKEGSTFYIVTEANCKTERRRNNGPYQIIVGADGVLSKFRKSADKGVFLVGDARWVNDRWFDLGLRRIDRGADIAMTDGLELGQAICNAIEHSRNVQKTIELINNETKNVFCASEVYNKKITRQLGLLALLLAVTLRHFM